MYRFAATLVRFSMRLLWRGPMDLELIDLSGGANAKNFPGIMRREITATIVLEALAQTYRRPSKESARQSHRGYKSRLPA